MTEFERRVIDRAAAAGLGPESAIELCAKLREIYGEGGGVEIDVVDFFSKRYESSIRYYPEEGFHQKLLAVYKQD